MQFIKVFDRKNRKLLADIFPKDGQWHVDDVGSADSTLNQKLSGVIQNITAYAPRHVGAFKESEKIVEVAENKEIEPVEENLPFLQRELSGWFPLYRFILIDENKIAEEETECKKLAKTASYLTPKQKEKILKMFEDLDKQEIPLLLDDINALERLAKLN